MDSILGLIITLVLYAVVIYIVGRLNLGLTVDGFVGAFIAGAAIAVVSWLVSLVIPDSLWESLGGFLGAIISLLVSAVVLLIADRFVPGMKVNGFVGAIIAAIAIAVVAWLFGFLLPAYDLNPLPTTSLLMSIL